jgi:membrane protease YdiL (CAAX protease family)
MLAGFVVCAVGVWLIRSPLKAMGEPWGHLPPNVVWPGLAVALAALFLPELIGVPGMISQWPDHGPLLSGLLTIAISAAGIGVLAMLQTLRPPHERLQWLEVKPANLARTLLVYAVMAPALMALLIAVVAGARLIGLEIEAQPQVQHLTGRNTPVWIAGVFALAGVGAPLREELIFRLVIYGSIASLATTARWTHPARVIALVVSISLFVAAHGTWLIGVLPLALLAWVLAALFAHSRSIWPPILLHAVHNTLVLVVQFYVL